MTSRQLPVKKFAQTQAQPRGICPHQSASASDLCDASLLRGIALLVDRLAGDAHSGAASDSRLAFGRRKIRLGAGHELCILDAAVPHARVAVRGADRGERDERDPVREHWSCERVG